MFAGFGVQLPDRQARGVELRRGLERLFESCVAVADSAMRPLTYSSNTCGADGDCHRLGGAEVSLRRRTLAPRCRTIRQRRSAHLSGSKRPVSSRITRAGRSGARSPSSSTLPMTTACAHRLADLDRRGAAEVAAAGSCRRSKARIRSSRGRRRSPASRTSATTARALPGASRAVSAPGFSNGSTTITAPGDAWAAATVGTSIAAAPAP